MVCIHFKMGDEEYILSNSDETKVSGDHTFEYPFDTVNLGYTKYLKFDVYIKYKDDVMKVESIKGIRSYTDKIEPEVLLKFIDVVNKIYYRECMISLMGSVGEYYELSFDKNNGLDIKTYIDFDSVSGSFEWAPIKEANQVFIGANVNGNMTRREISNSVVRIKDLEGVSLVSDFFVITKVDSLENVVELKGRLPELKDNKHTVVFGRLEKLNLFFNPDNSLDTVIFKDSCTIDKFCIGMHRLLGTVKTLRVCKSLENAILFNNGIDYIEHLKNLRKIIVSNESILLKNNEFMIKMKDLGISVEVEND